MRARFAAATIARGARNARRAGALVAAALLTGAALAACAGGARPAAPGGAATGTAAGPAATATGTPASAAASGPIGVTLREWAIDLTAPSAKAGALTFNTRNEGKVPHDLVVVRSDLAPDRLPTASGIVDEKQVTIVARTEQLTPGDSGRLNVTLTKGKYVLICNVIGHYNSGQFAPFTVE